MKSESGKRGSEIDLRLIQLPTKTLQKRKVKNASRLFSVLDSEETLQVFGVWKEFNRSRLTGLPRQQRIMVRSGRNVRSRGKARVRSFGNFASREKQT